MGKRVTVTVDDDLVRRLRTLQAKQIKKYQKSISFSKIINELIRKSLNS